MVTTRHEYARTTAVLPRAGDGSTRRFDDGAVIFRAGDRPDRLYQVLEGKVKLERRSDTGRHSVVNVFGPMDVFGEDGLLDGGPRSTTAVTMTPVTAVVLERTELYAQLLSDSELVDFLLRVVARRLRRTSDTITDLMSATVSARVAKHLLKLAQQFGVPRDGTVHLALDLTQEQFAQLAGTSRESLNKCLAEFSRTGWIELDGDRVVIVDSVPLTQHVDGSRRLPRRLP